MSEFVDVPLTSDEEALMIHGECPVCRTHGTLVDKGSFDKCIRCNARLGVNYDGVMCATILAEN